MNNIFIATLPRSGSTLLGMMLGAHSKVCHIGESAYWSKLDTRTVKCCCGMVGCQTLIKVFNIISSFPNEAMSVHDACGAVDLKEEPNKIRHSLSLSAEIINTDMYASTFQLCLIGLGKIADAFRIVLGKEIIVENSKYISIAEALLDEKSNWKIIVLMRDPRGVASCNKETGERKSIPRPVRDKINLFTSFANRAAAIIKQKNTMLVRYEDLCRNTGVTLGSICKFIGIQFEERMLRFKKYKGHLLMGNHMMHDMNEVVQEDIRWRYLLDTEEKHMFKRRDIAQAYANFGYDLMENY